MINCFLLSLPILMSILLLGLGTAFLCSETVAKWFVDLAIHVINSISPIKIPPNFDIIASRFHKAVFFYLIGLGFLAYPLFRDYTPYFPTNLKLRAHFDDAGIIESLNNIGENELAAKGIHIKPNWKKLKEGYMAGLNREVRDKFRGTGFTFSDSTQGQGYAFIKTTKAKKWLTYEITEGYGKIHWHYDKDKFDSEFNLNGKSIAKLGFKDVYFKWNSIIIPEYEQVIYMNPTNATIHHTIIAATKVTLFPFMDVSNSLYLYRGKGEKDYVPIGYAEYIF